MAAKDLGTKYTCFKCGAKFYDLKKPEPICPKCGADQREAAALRPAEKPERKRSARSVLDEPLLEEEVLEDEEETFGDDEDEVPDDSGDEDDF